MSDTTVNDLLSGALMMGYLVASVFFLKFHRSTKDRLFGLFSAAFLILSFQRLLLALTTKTFEDTVLIYVIRLVAFLIMLYAIVDKNISAKRTS